MIREIVTDPILLSRPSREATAEDLAVAADLKDTLIAHADHCAGMAANMIGQSVRVIAVFVALSVKNVISSRKLRFLSKYSAKLNLSPKRISSSVDSKPYSA